MAFSIRLMTLSVDNKAQLQLRQVFILDSRLSHEDGYSELLKVWKSLLCLSGETVVRTFEAVLCVMVYSLTLVGCTAINIDESLALGVAP